MADTLFDEIGNAHARPLRCPVGRCLQDLTKINEEQAKAFQRSLDNLNYEGTVISEVMTRKGHKMSDDAVQRHRRNACSCPKPN